MGPSFLPQLQRATLYYTAPPSRTDPLSTHLSCSMVLLCSAGCIVTATGGAYLAYGFI